MRVSSKYAVAFAAAALTLAAGIGAADAHKRRWQSVGECYPTVEGAASGTGILGLGSARARVAARANWEATASSLHGPEYSSLDRARGIHWDCKKNAILLAKCVVTAQPCGARLRG